MRLLRQGVLPAATCLVLLIGAATLAEQPPNVVLVMCDDMGWSDLGCYGGEIATPNIDRLAAQGLRFTQFYNNAKCTTTRASLLTGLLSREHGRLDRSMATVGEALQGAGYQTTLVGKWHLGRGPDTHPAHRGFDEFYGLLDGACNYFDPARRDPPYKGGQVRYFARNFTRITEFPADYYTTDAFTDEAIAAVRRMAGEDKPFFLHLCYTAPHYPLHAKPSDVAKYRGTYRDGWEALRRRRFQRQRELGVVGPHWTLSESDSQAYPWQTADQDFEDLRMAVYAAMVDSLDQNVGRLLQELDALQLANQTVVMLLSDNGGCSEEPGGRDPAVRRPGPVDDYVAVGPAWGWAQNAPFRRYKSWMHEGGVRTPLVVRWPGVVAPGGMTDQLGHVIDLLPTCLDLAGGEHPRRLAGRDLVPLEGTSLAPIFRGERREPPAELCWEFAGNAAIRRGKWKLVWDSLVKQWELYDIEADPTETHDLAADQPTRAGELAQGYNEWALATGNLVLPTPKAP
ncbi:MAG: arylsulfatase [Pirellulales bacterium]|nr:arylsulfatase [Pirellulales bacterium]